MPKQFQASYDQLEHILSYVCLQLEDRSFIETEHLKLLVEEVVSNIIEHSGSNHIEVDCAYIPHSGLSIAIKDDGIEFNPLTYSQQPIEEAEGLGIYLIKKLADSVEYRRESSRNILTLKYKT